MPRNRVYATNAERQSAYRMRSRGRTDSPVSFPCLPAISSMPGHKRWKGMLKYATLLVSLTAEEMESYFDDHSEQWQAGEQGESFTEILDSVQEALAALEDLPYQDKPSPPVS